MAKPSYMAVQHEQVGRLLAPLSEEWQRAVECVTRMLDGSQSSAPRAPLAHEFELEARRSSARAAPNPDGVRLVGTSCAGTTPLKPLFGLMGALSLQYVGEGLRGGALWSILFLQEHGRANGLGVDDSDNGKIGYGLGQKLGANSGNAK